VRVVVLLPPSIVAVVMVVGVEDDESRDGSRDRWC
jgi:hypothetical protein